MNDRELYRRTFSHLRSSSRIRWEDYQMHEPNRAPEYQEQPAAQQGLLARLLPRLLTAASVAALLAMVSGIALATNFLGLRDLLLPSGPGFSAMEGSTISMSGLANSPEGKALAEWEAFLDSYDPDHAILEQLSTVHPDLEKYDCYMVYTFEMADRLEEIAAKHGLKLHTDRTALSAHPELLPHFWGEDVNAHPMYIYEDGTFEMDGDAPIDGVGSVDFQLRRSVRGTLHDVLIRVEDISGFAGWNYRSACGVPVSLSLGRTRSFLLADLGDSVVVTAVLAGEDQGLTQAGLESLADRLDLTALTPAVPPVLPTPAPTETPAPSPAPDGTDSAAARTAYTAALKNWLNSDVLPDGTAGPDVSGNELDQFAVYDVDGDGAEELVALSLSGITASWQGLVLSYDPAAAVSFTVELNGTPFLTFYPGGFVMVKASHNHTHGEPWPYDLYRYDPGSGYTHIASVYAVSLSILEQVDMVDQYPSQADPNGTGTVYYVTADASAAEPEERLMDAAAYQAWLDAILGQDAQPLELPLLSLTQENIAALLK